jgi:dimethylargininase
VDVPAGEPWGANVLALPGATLVSAACPRTADVLRGLGHPVVVLNVSEIHKAEGGLTCMSLVLSREAGKHGFDADQRL